MSNSTLIQIVKDQKNEIECLRQEIIEVINTAGLDLQQLKKISEIDLEYRKSQSKERIEKLKRRMAEQRSRIEEFDRIRGAHLKLKHAQVKRQKHALI